MSGPRRSTRQTGRNRQGAGQRARKDQRGFVDTGVLKEQVGSRWLGLLKDLAPQLGDAIANPGRHAECPVHGGTDGFRLYPDAAETGGGICNTCENRKGGHGYYDGIELLRWVNSWTFPEVVMAIQEWLEDDIIGDEDSLDLEGEEL